MLIAIPASDSSRSVFARSKTWQWDTIIDASHSSIDVPVPADINPNDVEVFSFAVDAHGQRIPSSPGVVLKTRKR